MKEMLLTNVENEAYNIKNEELWSNFHFFVYKGLFKQFIFIFFLFHRVSNFFAKFQ